jgi:hypothetical protein
MTYMDAILELIKTIIPFSLGFLFLWAIGRMCCTTNTKPKTMPDGELDHEEVDNKSNKSTVFDQKQDFFFDKEDILESKHKLGTGKQNMFSSKQDIMFNKADIMTKKSIIPTDHSIVVELNESLTFGKKQKLSVMKKAFILKEILDAPKAIKPYRGKYPR